jgi:Family of unknown function (DUF6489)
MKITTNIDCTPEEARALLGLPDVRPMQETLMREMQERMLANVRGMTPEEMFRMWLPANLKGFEQMAEMFFPQARDRKE